MSRAAASVFFVFALAAFSQPPLTSDSTKARLLPQPNPGVYSGRAAQYVEPKIDYFSRLETNTRPVVVEITVMSNRMLRVSGYVDGHLTTNELVLSSNLVSRTTNNVFSITNGPALP